MEEQIALSDYQKKLIDKENEILKLLSGLTASDCKYVLNEILEKMDRLSIIS